MIGLVMNRILRRAMSACAILTGIALGAGATLSTTTPEAQAQSSASDVMGSLDLLNGLLNQLNGQQNSNLPGAVAPENPVEGKASQSTRTFTTANGAKRTAIVRIPANSQGKRLPVMFMFGGWQHDAAKTQSYSLLERTGAGTDAIIVYPQAIDNAWEGAPYAVSKRGEDVAFVRQIAQALDAEGRADMSRIYAAGLSNGGGMALTLACQAPDLVKAVVGVAGAYYNPTISNCKPGAVRTMIMHGTLDDVMTYDGGTRHGAPYYSIPAALRNVANRNGCDTSATEYTRQITINVDQFEYPNCAKDTILWKVTGQGHTWFPYAPNAAQAAWEFVTER